jgi:hypothetical protein
MSVRAGFTFGNKKPLWRKKIEPHLDTFRHSGREPVRLLRGAGETNLPAFVIGGGTGITIGFDPALSGEQRAPGTEGPAALRRVLAELTQHIRGHHQAAIPENRALTHPANHRLFEASAAACR